MQLSTDRIIREARIAAVEAGARLVRHKVLNTHIPRDILISACHTAIECEVLAAMVRLGVLEIRCEKPPELPLEDIEPKELRELVAEQCETERQAYDGR